MNEAISHAAAIATAVERVASCYEELSDKPFPIEGEMHLAMFLATGTTIIVIRHPVLGPRIMDEVTFNKVRGYK